MEAKRRNVTAVCALSLVLLWSSADYVKADVITFDDVPGTGTRVFDGSRYQSRGVVFSPGGGGVLSVKEFLNPFTGMTSNVIFGPGNEKSEIIVDFMLPGTDTPGLVKSFTGVVVSGEMTGSYNISTYAFDEVGYGGLVSTTRGDLPFVGGTFSTSVSATTPRFQRAVFTLSPNVYFHSLRFGEITPPPTPSAPPTSVPEPGALLLLGTALIAVAAEAGRRRRRARHHRPPLRSK